ncbi:hypothetical protein [Adlercreutzia sp. ZJ242]|uniref:hypothetical protein n=1 Tax=Adlercreutzia sp. ZJ242 TaxID=2709409 RepID=UPI0013E9F211|nr:hypothetical protein [Adlercreutzia sp. ZJ242]
MDERVVESLGSFLKEHLEADVAFCVAERLDVSAEEAMGIYYGSKIAEAVEEGSLGMQYLPASYLADEVLKDAASASAHSLRS